MSDVQPPTSQQQQDAPPSAKAPVSKTKKAASKPASKKAPASKAKAATAATKKAAKPAPKTAEHPSYQEMILEAIEAEDGGSRFGISRQGIKKYIETMYHIEATAQTNNFIANAIKRGEETGVFSLPKGAAGKVKKASKTSSVGKENVKPVSKTTATKSVPVKKATNKKITLTKKAVSKAVSKKPTTKATVKKTLAKKAVASATKKTASKKATTKKTTSSLAPTKAAAAPRKAPKDRSNLPAVSTKIKKVAKSNAKAKAT